jgi:hypothetical protein
MEPSSETISDGDSDYNGNNSVREEVEGGDGDDAQTISAMKVDRVVLGGDTDSNDNPAGGQGDAGSDSKVDVDIENSDDQNKAKVAEDKDMQQDDSDIEHDAVEADLSPLAFSDQTESGIEMEPSDGELFFFFLNFIVLGCHPDS